MYGDWKRVGCRKALHSVEIDHTGWLVEVDSIRRLGDPQPVGCEPFRFILERDGAPAAEDFPIWVYRGCVGTPGGALPFERVEEGAQALAPASHEIDRDRVAEPLDLPALLELELDDETAVVDRLGNVECDVDVVLHGLVIGGCISAHEKDFRRPVFKCATDLAPPAIARLQSQDVGKYVIAFCFQFRRKPKSEFIVRWRRLQDEENVAGRRLGVGAGNRRQKPSERRRDRRGFGHGVGDGLRDDGFEDRTILSP